MSHFTAAHKRYSIGRLSALYDTRFGTATDASGWITFGLHSGNRRVWVNSARADDTGDGLSAATAKKTLDAGLAVFWGAGSAGGDQLMIASGGTYTDNKTGNWSLLNGSAVLNSTSAVPYPTCVLSYDPADAANSAKYGKITGSAMPSITLATSSSSFEISTENSGAANYFFIQGIEFTAANDGAGYAINWNFRHNGVGVQNCRFNRVGLGINNAGSALGLSTTIHVSKTSFAGQWTTSALGGTAVGLYIGGLDGLYWEDCVFAHCGWKIVAGSVNTRGSTLNNGDPNVFSHGFYYHAAGLNGRAQRLFGIDSAHDTLNFRGGTDSNVCVTLDDPIAATFGGFSGGYLEAPLGVTQHHTDHLYMGGSVMNSTAGNEYGWGPRDNNTIGDSYLKNCLAIDNPQRSTGANSFLYPQNDDTNQVPSFFTVQHVRTYNYAASLESPGGADTTKVHRTFNDCIVDSLTTGGNGDTSARTEISVSTYSGGTYPGAQTRDQIITTLLTNMGITPSGASYLARKSQLVNLACWRPELPWAQMLIDIALPAYGMTPTYQMATIPNLSAESPRAVYS